MERLFHPKNAIQWGSVLAGLGVLIGAFAAHGLQSLVNAYSISIIETGVRYQFIHSLAIILIGILTIVTKDTWLVWSVGLMVLGIILFSGSLYFLALKSLIGLEGLSRIIGPLTPIGGLCFIAAWILLFVRARNYGSLIS